MVKRLRMTHEEHVELSKVLENVVPSLELAITTVGHKLGVSTKAYRALRATLAKYDVARSELDDHYHAITTNSQFAEKGHVYYGGRNL